MTDRDVRRHLALASVVFVCALTLAASYGIVSDVDRERQQARVVTVPRARLTPLAHATPQEVVASVASAQPPVPGLVAAPAPRKRVVVVRRTRAS
jgi:hypothetical protein